MATADTTLYTGRDILAAENYLRCAKSLSDCRRALAEMPAEVVARLAAHVGADPTQSEQIIHRAKLPHRAR